jgi:hypothetical protein
MPVEELLCSLTNQRCCRNTNVTINGRLTALVNGSGPFQLCRQAGAARRGRSFSALAVAAHGAFTANARSEEVAGSTLCGSDKKKGDG